MCNTRSPYFDAVPYLAAISIPNSLGCILRKGFVVRQNSTLYNVDQDHRRLHDGASLTDAASIRFGSIYDLGSRSRQVVASIQPVGTMAPFERSQP